MSIRAFERDVGQKKPHPECWRIWNTFAQDLGAEPTHNTFVAMAVRRGVSRTKAREDFQILKRGIGSNGTPPAQGETVSSDPVMYETTVHETETVPVEHIMSAALSRRLEALEGQVQQLRDLVMQLSPRQSQDASDLTGQLGKLVARVTSQDRAQQALEAQIADLKSYEGLLVALVALREYLVASAPAQDMLVRLVRQQAVNVEQRFVVRDMCDALRLPLPQNLALQ